jgi:hypothetical protein
LSARNYPYLRQVIQAAQTRETLRILDHCIRQLPPDTDGLLLRQLCGERWRALSAVPTPSRANVARTVQRPSRSHRWLSVLLPRWLARVLSRQIAPQTANEQASEEAAA